MSPDDIKKKLAEAGIPSGETWGQTQGGKTVKSPIIERQKKNLAGLRDLVQKQIATDQQQVAELGAALVRLKRGGGV